jgi:hypothetical protein
VAITHRSRSLPLRRDIPQAQSRVAPLAAKRRILAGE